MKRPRLHPGTASEVPEVIAAGVHVSVTDFERQREAIEQRIRAATGTEVVLDMAGDYRVSSLTVAAMLAWLRQGHALGKRVSFVNLPDRLLDIIEFSGLEETLGVAGSVAAPAESTG